jgi:predicted lactoylglutathione lyase
MTSVQNKANVKQAVPFFWVSNIKTSLKYYIDGLGFEINNQWVDEGKVRWCWLQLGGAAIMLQEFWKNGQHTDIPKSKLGEGVTIYFICEDAVACYKEMVTKGVNASQPIVHNGLWTTSLSDPDGYRIVFESATEEPENTVFGS